MKKVKFRKAGYFDHESLTVKFGGPLSKPDNIFVAKAIKVPKYSLTSYERECLGNGWYGSNKEKVVREYDNTYLIYKDGQLIGYMRPYHGSLNLKSDLIPIDGIKGPLKYILEEAHKITQ